MSKAYYVFGGHSFLKYNFYIWFKPLYGAGTKRRLLALLIPFVPYLATTVSLTVHRKSVGLTFLLIFGMTLALENTLMGLWDAIDLDLRLQGERGWVDFTPARKLPLLIGQLRTSEGLGRLEKRLRRGA